MSTPPTEEANPRTGEIDLGSALEIVRLMNDEDRSVASAVGAELENVARAIETIEQRLRAGGRLVYVGAGTSGRLGVLDASECPPTFSTPPDLVVGIIAGGEAALTRAVEAAEDSPEMGAQDLANLGVEARDAVIGLSASGTTPYVIGALAEARRRGAAAIAITCGLVDALAGHAELVIALRTGPEVITGSTRLKAGTAQKMVLNMLSTAAMIRLGKTFGNRMVDVQATNHKLRARARRIVAEVAGVPEDAAEQLLQACGWQVKTALVVEIAGCNVSRATELLASAGGRVREALRLAGAVRTS